MVGIFGNRGVTPFAPVQDEYGMAPVPLGMLPSNRTVAQPQPQEQQSGGGIFGNLFNLPESGDDGYSAANRAQLFFANLRDVAESFDGNRTQYGALAQQQVDSEVKRQQNARLKQAVKGAMRPDGSVDWSVVRNAMIKYGDDPTAAFKIGQDDYDVAGNSIIRKPYGGGMPQIVQTLPKEPTTPSIVATAQYLFPNDPVKQREYVIRNSAASVKGISSARGGGSGGYGASGAGNSTKSKW